MIEQLVPMEKKAIYMSGASDLTVMVVFHSHRKFQPGGPEVPAGCSRTRPVDGQSEGGTRAELPVTGSSGQVPAYFRNNVKTLLEPSEPKNTVSRTCPEVGRKFRWPELPVPLAGTSGLLPPSFFVGGAGILLTGASGRNFRF